MSLPLFPEELFSKIFQNLSCKGKSLSNVCLASRKFHRIATPLLYGDIVAHFHGHKTALATTLAKDPELQSFVQRVDLCPDCCHILQGRWDESEACIVPTMVLLNLMPNLRELRLWGFRSRGLLQVFGGPRVFIPAGLQNITSLDLSWEDDGGGCTAKDVAMCMSLPSLTELSIDPVNHDTRQSYDESSSLLALRRGTSSVEDLTIRYWGAQQPFSALQSMISVPSALTSLRIHIVEFPGWNPDGNPSNIVDGLWTSRATLKDLTVITNGLPWGWFTSLAAFTQLSTLRCDLSLLLNSTREGPTSVIPLPSSLHLLGVGWNKHGERHKEAVLQMRITRRLPVLRCFSVDYSHSLDQEARDSIKRSLLGACEPIGIELVLDGGGWDWISTGF